MRMHMPVDIAMVKAMNTMRAARQLVVSCRVEGQQAATSRRCAMRPVVEVAAMERDAMRLIGGAS